MTLKELTKDKHEQAENTKFMQRVFDGKLKTSVWNDYTVQRAYIYSAIELKCMKFNLIPQDSELIRAPKLWYDYNNTEHYSIVINPKSVTIDYIDHINQINGPTRILAHLYTWHMGDMFGGQAIKKLIQNVSHTALEFEDRSGCITLIRNLCEKYDVVNTDEPNVAFEWAIKLLESYDDVL